MQPPPRPPCQCTRPHPPSLAGQAERLRRKRGPPARKSGRGTTAGILTSASTTAASGPTTITAGPRKSSKASATAGNANGGHAADPLNAKSPPPPDLEMGGFLLPVNRQLF